MTVTVNTLVDEADGSIVDGDVSLRDAIALAPAGEIINFSVTGDIVLQLGELVIDKPLTIIGPGADLLTIDASGNDPTPDSFFPGYHNLGDPNAGDGSRVFNVDDGDSGTFANVAIVGLTLTGGDVSGSGGAVFSSENLTIADTHIYRNAATPPSGAGVGGGGIFTTNEGGNVTITGSVIQANWTTGEGGGIYARTASSRNVSTTIIDSTITQNRAAGDGGGILSNTSGIHSTTTISGVTVSNNYSGGDGGGINASTRDALTLTTIDDSSITGNTAAGRGGGVSIFTNNAGYTEVNNTTVSRNSHGGINTGTLWDNATTITITDSLITQNSNELGNGGGINSFGPLTVSHSTVSGNLAVGVSADGGGIYGGAGLVVTYSVISGNATSGRGGGIEASQGITLTHSSVTDNTARYGGGADIANAFGSETLISSSTFSGNSADISGGAINGFAFAGDTVIENTTISGNSAGQDGGGIAAWLHVSGIFPGSLSIRHSTIVDNVADAAGSGFATGGGGILITGNSPPELSHTIIARNRLGDGTPDDINGTVDAGSDYNLVGVDAGLVGISNGVAGNQIGTIAAPLDPLLGALADNGGPTLPDGNALLTHAPLSGSPALDSGDPNFTPPPDTDERGFMRVIDGNGDGTARIDIGAVEYQPPALPGDGNLDGVVNADDYFIWMSHFGENLALNSNSPVSPQNGDYNNDGVVDGLDYIVWATNFGATSPKSTSQQQAAQDSVLASDALLGTAGVDSTTAELVAVNQVDQNAIYRAFESVFNDLAVKKNSKHQP